MEGRRPGGLHLEMTDLDPGAYRARRGELFPGARVTLFTNQVRDRADLPRTLPEFDLLAVSATLARGRPTSATSAVACCTISSLLGLRSGWKCSSGS